MDTLFWTAFNPNIKLLETKKAMHGNCLYRLCVMANGSALLRQQDVDLAELVVNHNRSRNLNYGGSWRRRPITQHNADLLKVVHAVRSSVSDNIKVRIEDPYVQFYSVEEQPLRDLAQKLLFSDNEHFYSWMAPVDQYSKDILIQGKVIRKRPPKYQYKVIIRDGKFSEQTRKGLKNWLTHQSADEVHVPKSLLNTLNTDHRFIWGGYIYINDLRTTTFLGLIDPNLIARIEEFHYVGSEE